MNNVTSVPPHLRRYMDLSRQQAERVRVEGKCATCGERPHLPDAFQCTQCLGPAAAAFQSESPAPRPQPMPTDYGSRFPPWGPEPGTVIDRGKRKPEPVEPLALKTSTLAELAERPESQTEWLVDDLLPLSGLSLWFAPPKAGKSTLARCLATVCAGGGGDWIGHKAKGGPVLYLSLEERLATIRSHFDALDADGSRIHLLDQRPPDPKLRADMLALAMQRIKPALVIVDPLVRWVPVKDLNDYALTTAALDEYLRLARGHVAHLVFIHHSRKSAGEHGQEALGSTALTGSVDTWLSIRRNGSNRRTISGEGRDGVALPEVVLTMDPQTQWITAGGAVAEAVADDLDFEIMSFVRECEEHATAHDIREHVGKRKQAVVAALRRLTNSGRLNVSTLPGSGRKLVYSIPSLFPVPAPGQGTGNSETNGHQKITDDDIPF